MINKTKRIKQVADNLMKIMNNFEEQRRKRPMASLKIRIFLKNNFPLSLLWKIKIKGKMMLNPLNSPVFSVKVVCQYMSTVKMHPLKLTLPRAKTNLTLSLQIKLLISNSTKYLGIKAFQRIKR